MELISISRILPAFPNFFISLYLHKPFQTKGKNEIKKAITWLQKVRNLGWGTHRLCTEWGLREILRWTHRSCCFLTWAQQGAALCQQHGSTPTGICSHGKQIMHRPHEHCFTLFSPWIWEWDYGQVGGSMERMKKPIFWNSQGDWGL